MAVKNLPNYTSGDGFGMPLNIRRGNPNPLDNSELFESYADAQDYAINNPVAYVGQIITTVATAIDGSISTTTYRIEDEAGTLKQLTADGDIDMDEITEQDIDDIISSVFGS